VNQPIRFHSAPSLDVRQSLSPLAECGALLNRRTFLAGAAAGSLSLLNVPAFADSPRDALFCCGGSDPIACLRRRQYRVLVAFVETQLTSLWNGGSTDVAEVRPQECAVAVTEDILKYAEHLEYVYRAGICGAVALVAFYSHQQTGHGFSTLSIPERMNLLNQGEYQTSRWYRPGQQLYPLIRHEVDYPLHTAVSSLSMLTKLVTNARRPARLHINLIWSDICKRPERLVHVPPPPYPDLTVEYDVCVVGSGAGGAVLAARAAEAGKRVLLIEKGAWVSPCELVERHPGPDGRTVLSPARCDVVSTRVYDQAGVDLAGTLDQLLEGNRLQFVFEQKRQQVRPKQSINLLKASVVGGGPYVNNAIHLAIREETWNSWGDFCPTGLTYQEFRTRMQEVSRAVGANRQVSLDRAGNRSLVFARGAALADVGAEPVPVSIIPGCDGCGADNSVDPFGNHTGGVHPYRPDGPNSYLMRALHATPQAQVAYQMKAIRFECGLRQAEPALSRSKGGLNAAGTLQSNCLVVEDRRPGTPGHPHRRRPHLRIRARQFVLAAGPVASTNILRNTMRHGGFAIPHLGERLNANVATAVYGVYDKPIVDSAGSRPEPGITQVFFVERKQVTTQSGTQVVEPALENWFHFPGTVALALTGWFDTYARVMNRYNHISIAGMVVPTKIRPQNRVKADGKVTLELDREEFELLLAGMRRIARIFLAAATPDNGVTIYLPTKGLLLDEHCRPRTIRNEADLEVALDEIRRRGPAFVNMLTTHLQGGNSLGLVTSRDTFRVMTQPYGEIENLYVADASIFPAGCETNPQLTIKALAHYAADAMLQR
jgi:choline dehydrogenase-like flavoprotein